MEFMLVALLLVLPSGSLEDLLDHSGHETREFYSNEWLVRLEGGPEVAELLATQLGYSYAGPVVGFPNTYRMLKSDHPPLLKRGYSRLTQRLVRDTRVVWAEQQFPKQRVKRGLVPTTDGRPHRSKRGDLPVPRVERLFNDELWDQEWYMQDTRTRPDLPKLDLHVVPVYRMGITGRGVRVVVLDDGLEYTHQDLQANYDPEISYDANDNDEDPLPRYDGDYSNAHGTRCAGEIAMMANNRKCGVGIAFNSRIGGIRLLDGSVNDRVEGTALGYAYDKVDIYSASWGPNDDGMTVEGPGRLAKEAIERGIKQGRDGKGCIFVWASGNGGSRGDNCNCDGYIGSIYTLSVSSASQQGQFPWYGERCASTMAATYSSGAYSDQMIATTDLRNSCTVKHTGTSASAPLAAGIIALALEANPELTWRDVQHLVTWTAEYAPLSDNLGWTRNAAGFWINTRFGFGLMNAHGLVTAAINWTNVPTQVTCMVPAEPMTNLTLEHGQLSSVKFISNGCVGTLQEIHYLEHVQVEANIAYPVRGVLEIYLTSAAGTKVQLLSPRKFDQSDMGFINWRFMSVLTWGESPTGTWTIEVIDKIGKPGYQGELGQFTLILHGTKEQPQHLKNGPRRYNENYNRMHRKMAQETVTTIEEMEAQNDNVALDWNDIVGVPIELQRSHLSKSKLREWILKLLGLGDY